MTSRVALNSDGRSVEVGIVGREGMVGMSLTVGLRRGTFRAIMQMSGNGLRIRAEALEAVLGCTPTLRSELSRFALMHGMQVAQLAACNRLHEIEQRLARWLLMCQDRVDSQMLPLTHEFLAQMLGTGRPSVSLAAGVLESAGLIENMRGTVKILNRKVPWFRCQVRGWKSRPANAISQCGASTETQDLACRQLLFGTEQTLFLCDSIVCVIALPLSKSHQVAQESQAYGRHAFGEYRAGR
jgi:CRP-like cAMP-binding protein